VPAPVPLVAVGPHLKNTFTLAHGDRAYVSQHIGDLEGLDTVAHFEDALDRLRRLFSVTPEIAVRDLHPGYLSTRLAEALGLRQVIPVQHHHAHVAAVMAEHGRTAAVLGIAFDGTGYGDDGRTWGAELLAADLTGYRRLAHLRYIPMPGGDLAARTPWRVAAGYVAAEPSVAAAFRLAFTGVDPRERAVAERQAAAGLNAPLASSMGRLFDAAAAVLGVRRVSDYEGQAAMELEALAGRRVAREYRCEVTGGGEGPWVLDPVPLLVELGERRQSGEDAADLAADFHASVARATAELARRGCEAAGLDTVALGGGVFQNARLLESVRARLEREGLRALLPHRLGPNDGPSVTARPPSPPPGSPTAWAEAREALMCLGIPGRVLEMREDRGLAMGQVDFGGVRREVCLAYVADQVRPGDYVVVHVGFAISRVDEEEARRTFEALREMSQLEELDWMREVAEQSLAAAEGGGA
jgi:hydrogenase maturation protein HypF